MGFGGYLGVKEDYTVTAGDGEGTARTREGRALFLDTHQRPFAAGLRAFLAGASAAHHRAEEADFLAEWAGCGAPDLEAPAAIDTCGPGAGEDAVTCCGCGDGERRP